MTLSPYLQDVEWITSNENYKKDVYLPHLETFSVIRWESWIKLNWAYIFLDANALRLHEWKKGYPRMTWRQAERALNKLDLKPWVKSMN